MVPVLKPNEITDVHHMLTEYIVKTPGKMKDEYRDATNARYFEFSADVCVVGSYGDSLCSLWSYHSQ